MICSSKDTVKMVRLWSYSWALIATLTLKTAKQRFCMTSYHWFPGAAPRSWGQRSGWERTAGCRRRIAGWGQSCPGWGVPATHHHELNGQRQFHMVQKPPWALSHRWETPFLMKYNTAVRPTWFRDHPDGKHPVETTCWETTLMKDTLRTECPDERHPDERHPD